MVDYADLNPSGATRTSKTGRIRLVPQTLNYFNQKWFKDFMSDFQWKNTLENNGVISGCVISDGGGNSIDCTAGEVYINGTKYTISAPANFPTTGDGWYVAYAKTDLSVVYGKMVNADVQGALTPDNAVLLGFVVQGQSTFFVKSYFNNVSEFSAHIAATAAHGVSGDILGSSDSQSITNKTISESNITVGAAKIIDVSLGTLTLSNDQISGDKVHGGTISGSPTIVTPTIADASNVSKVGTVKDQNGVATAGTKSKTFLLPEWDMNVSSGGTSFVEIAHGVDADKIDSLVVLIKGDSVIDNPADTVNGRFQPDLESGMSAVILPSDIRLKVIASGPYDGTAFNNSPGTGSRGICRITYYD